MVQITASKCKCSAYGWYLLYGVGTQCHGTSAQNKPILLTDNHQLSGTAGIYLCFRVLFCFVFCFKTYLRGMQIKNILIKSESNVKDKWKMQLWNKQCRKNSNYCHPTCKIPERLSRNKLQWLYVIWTRFFFKKPCFTLCFVYKNVKYTFHLLWKLVRCESHFKLILITQV